MEKKRNFDYDVVLEKINAYRAEHPNASNSQIYKAIGISDYVFSRAMDREKHGARKSSQTKASYKKVVSPAILPTISPSDSKLTVFVIKGDSASIAQMLEAMN